MRASRTPRPKLPLWTGKVISRAEMPPPKEVALHIQVADVLRVALSRDWFWFHCPNGELRDDRTAAKLKAMGVQPGVPDLSLISPAGLYHGLELKRKGEPLSDDQDAFHAFAKARGWPIATADTFEAAVATLTAWGALRTTMKTVLATLTGARHV